MAIQYDDNSVNETIDTEVDLENDAVETDGNVDDDVENVDESTPEEGEEGVVAPQKKQSSKQDAAFAEMRRKLEAAEKEAQRYREINSKASNLFKDYGVKTIDEYLDKVEVQLLEQRKEQLKEQGFDDATIDSMLKDSQDKMRLQRENESLKRQQYELSLRSSFEEVQKAFPEDNIKSVDDISDEVWALADKGYSLLHAYKIVNEDKIIERKAAAAKQKTLNNINSKKHLKTESDGPGSASDTMIPEDVLQGYKDMGFNKKEAIAHYKKIYG